MSIELRYDEEKALDELVGQMCFVHLERMDNHWFTLSVDDGRNGVMLQIGIPTSAQVPVYATVYEQGPSDLCMECLFSKGACKCGTSQGGEPAPHE